MYIDAHAHLDKYDLKLEQAIAEIEQHKIFTVSVSMDPAEYAKAKAIEKRTRWSISTFGVHPWNAPAFQANLEALQPLMDDSPMVGEIGLDYYFVSEPEKHALQRDVFQYLAERGISQKKILNIHSKGAEADLDRIMGDLGTARAILHWYSGSLKQLHRFAEKGAYFSVGVAVLFSKHVKQIAKANCRRACRKISLLRFHFQAMTSFPSQCKGVSQFQLSWRGLPGRNQALNPHRSRPEDNRDCLK